jgi:hypothetical protein
MEIIISGQNLGKLREYLAEVGESIVESMER